MAKEVESKVASQNPWYTGDQIKELSKERVRWGVERRWNFIEKVLKYISERNKGKEIKILDAGCGDGVNLLFLSRFEFLSIRAVDYNPLRVERVKKLFPKIDVYEADLRNLKYCEEFDFILCSQVLEHIQEDELVLKNLNKALKPTGDLVLGVPNEGCFLARLRNNVFQKNISRTTDHVHFYTTKTIKEKISRSGFKIQEILYEGFFYPHSYLHMLINSFRVGFILSQFLGKIFPSQTAGYYFWLKKFTNYVLL